jgi:acyl-CoA thioesterase I
MIKRPKEKFPMKNVISRSFQNFGLCGSMSKYLFGFFLIMAFLVNPAFAQIRILPLGDSITANEKTKSYRYYLYDLLKNRGDDIDFMGTQRYQIYDNFDSDNQEHPGWTADQIAESLPKWLSTYTPDVVLLHIGHSDQLQGKTVASTITDIEKIIGLLQADNPRVLVLLAQIINPSGSHAWFDQLNARIPGVASRTTTNTSKVVAVDMNTMFDSSTMTDDRVHPNDIGDQFIAEQWYNVLVEQDEYKALGAGSPEQPVDPSMVLNPPVIRIVPDNQ